MSSCFGALLTLSENCKTPCESTHGPPVLWWSGFYHIKKQIYREHSFWSSDLGVDVTRFIPFECQLPRWETMQQREASLSHPFGFCPSRISRHHPYQDLHSPNQLSLLYKLKNLRKVECPESATKLTKLRVDKNIEIPDWMKSRENLQIERCRWPNIKPKEITKKIVV